MFTNSIAPNKDAIKQINDEAMHCERARILDVYQRRSPGDYAFSDLWSLQIAQRREFLMARMLRDAGILSLTDRRILDVGCGDGRLLRLFSRWGAAPEQLFGCDINAERLGEARRLQPGADYRLVDGYRLPYDRGSFEVVCQFTVFTSILAPSMRSTLAAEMQRVLGPNGIVLWFDFRYDNPRNRSVQGVGRREIDALFPDCDVKCASLGLLPPLARRLVPISPTLATLFELIPPLRYAYLAVIRPRSN